MTNKIPMHWLAKLFIIILLVGVPIFLISISKSSAASLSVFSCGTNPVPGTSYFSTVAYSAKVISNSDGSFVWYAGFGDNKIKCTTKSTFNTTPVKDSLGNDGDSQLLSPLSQTPPPTGNLGEGINGIGTGTPPPTDGGGSITGGIGGYTPNDGASCGMVEYDGGPWNANGTKRIKVGDNPDDFGYYRTVVIKGKCFFRDNMNAGMERKIVKGELQKDDKTIEKYCYGGNSNNCVTYGGLYERPEAYQYTRQSEPFIKNAYILPVQGVCPDGWQIFNVNDLVDFATKRESGTVLDARFYYPYPNFEDMGGVDVLKFDAPKSGAARKGWPNGTPPSDQWYNQLGKSFNMITADYGVGIDKDEYFDWGCLCWKKKEILKVYYGGLKFYDFYGSNGKYMSGTDQNFAYSVRCMKETAYTSPADTWKPDPRCGDKNGLIQFDGGPRDASGKLNSLGGYYRTVYVNGKCWFAENLNNGKFVTSSDWQVKYLERYCYSHNSAKCFNKDEDVQGGGLYLWEKLVKYNNIVCPNGWRIPTAEDAESLVSAGGSNLVRGGSSGFNADFVGYYDVVGNGSKGIFFSYGSRFMIFTSDHEKRGSIDHARVFAIDRNMNDTDNYARLEWLKNEGRNAASARCMMDANDDPGKDCAGQVVIEGDEYDVVWIDKNGGNNKSLSGQCWMNRNLMIGTPARDQANTYSIAKMDSTVGKQYINYSFGTPTYKYGALYSYREFIGANNNNQITSLDDLCPAGWHAATKDEWDTLFFNVQNSMGLYHAEECQGISGCASTGFNLSFPGKCMAGKETLCADSGGLGETAYYHLPHSVTQKMIKIEKNKPGITPKPSSLVNAEYNRNANAAASVRCIKNPTLIYLLADTATSENRASALVNLKVNQASTNKFTIVKLYNDNNTSYESDDQEVYSFSIAGNYTDKLSEWSFDGKHAGKYCFYAKASAASGSVNYRSNTACVDVTNYNKNTNKWSGQEFKQTTIPVNEKNVVDVLNKDRLGARGENFYASSKFYNLSNIKIQIKNRNNIYTDAKNCVIKEINYDHPANHLMIMANEDLTNNVSLPRYDNGLECGLSADWTNKKYVEDLYYKDGIVIKAGGKLSYAINFTRYESAIGLNGQKKEEVKYGEISVPALQKLHLANPINGVSGSSFSVSSANGMLKFLAKSEQGEVLGGPYTKDRGIRVAPSNVFVYRTDQSGKKVDGIGYGLKPVEYPVNSYAPGGKYNGEDAWEKEFDVKTMLGGKDSGEQYFVLCYEKHWNSQFPYDKTLGALFGIVSADKVCTSPVLYDVNSSIWINSPQAGEIIKRSDLKNKIINVDTEGTKIFNEIILKIQESDQHGKVLANLSSSLSTKKYVFKWDVSKLPDGYYYLTAIGKLGNDEVVSQGVRIRIVDLNLVFKVYPYRGNDYTKWSGAETEKVELQLFDFGNTLCAAKEYQVYATLPNGLQIKKELVNGAMDDWGFVGNLAETNKYMSAMKDWNFLLDAVHAATFKENSRRILDHDDIQPKENTFNITVYADCFNDGIWDKSNTVEVELKVADLKIYQDPNDLVIGKPITDLYHLDKLSGDKFNIITDIKNIDVESVNLFWREKGTNDFIKFGSFSQSLGVYKFTSPTSYKVLDDGSQGKQYFEIMAVVTDKKGVKTNSNILPFNVTFRHKLEMDTYNTNKPNTQQYVFGSADWIRMNAFSDFTYPTGDVRFGQVDDKYGLSIIRDITATFQSKPPYPRTDQKYNFGMDVIGMAPGTYYLVAYSQKYGTRSKVVELTIRPGNQTVEIISIANNIDNPTPSKDEKNPQTIFNRSSNIMITVKTGTFMNIIDLYDEKNQKLRNLDGTAIVCRHQDLDFLTIKCGPWTGTRSGLYKIKVKGIISGPPWTEHFSPVYYVDFTEPKLWLTATPSSYSWGSDTQITVPFELRANYPIAGATINISYPLGGKLTPATTTDKYGKPLVCTDSKCLKEIIWIAKQIEVGEGTARVVATDPSTLRSASLNINFSSWEAKAKIIDPAPDINNPRIVQPIEKFTVKMRTNFHPESGFWARIRLVPESGLPPLDFGNACQPQPTTVYDPYFQDQDYPYEPASGTLLPYCTVDLSTMMGVEDGKYKVTALFDYIDSDGKKHTNLESLPTWVQVGASPKDNEAWIYDPIDDSNAPILVRTNDILPVMVRTSFDGRDKSTIQIDFWPINNLNDKRTSKCINPISYFDYVPGYYYPEPITDNLCKLDMKTYLGMLLGKYEMKATIVYTDQNGKQQPPVISQPSYFELTNEAKYIKVVKPDPLLNPKPVFWSELGYKQPEFLNFAAKPKTQFDTGYWIEVETNFDTKNGNDLIYEYKTPTRNSPTAVLCATSLGKYENLAYEYKEQGKYRYICRFLIQNFTKSENRIVVPNYGIYAFTFQNKVGDVKSEELQINLTKPQGLAEIVQVNTTLIDAAVNPSTIVLVKQTGSQNKAYVYVESNEEADGFWLTKCLTGDSSILYQTTRDNNLTKLGSKYEYKATHVIDLAQVLDGTYCVQAISPQTGATGNQVILDVKTKAEKKYDPYLIIYSPDPNEKHAYYSNDGIYIPIQVNTNVENPDVGKMMLIGGKMVNGTLDPNGLKVGSASRIRYNKFLHRSGKYSDGSALDEYTYYVYLDFKSVDSNVSEPDRYISNGEYCFNAVNTGQSPVMWSAKPLCVDIDKIIFEIIKPVPDSVDLVHGSNNLLRVKLKTNLGKPKDAGQYPTLFLDGVEKNYQRYSVPTYPDPADNMWYWEWDMDYSMLTNGTYTLEAGSGGVRSNQKTLNISGTPSKFFRIAINNGVDSTDAKGSVKVFGFNDPFVSFNTMSYPKYNRVRVYTSNGNPGNKQSDIKLSGQKAFLVYDHSLTTDKNTPINGGIGDQRFDISDLDSGEYYTAAMGFNGRWEYLDKDADAFTTNVVRFIIDKAQIKIINLDPEKDWIDTTKPTHHYIRNNTPDIYVNVLGNKKFDRVDLNVQSLVNSTETYTLKCDPDSQQADYRYKCYLNLLLLDMYDPEKYELTAVGISGNQAPLESVPVIITVSQKKIIGISSIEIKGEDYNNNTWGNDWTGDTGDDNPDFQVSPVNVMVENMHRKNLELWVTPGSPADPCRKYNSGEGFVAKMEYDELTKNFKLNDWDYGRMDQNHNYTIKTPSVGYLCAYAGNQYTALKVVHYKYNGTDKQKFVCGNVLTDSRDGQKYHTYFKGNNCWIADNLNVGIKKTPAEQIWYNGVYDKSCYNDDDTECIKEENGHRYGALYTWEEAMQTADPDTDTKIVQGICPVGWEMPGKQDWRMLEIAEANGGICNETIGRGFDHCKNAGQNMKDMSKFATKLVGWYSSGFLGGKYQDEDEYAKFWSKSYVSGNPTSRVISGVINEDLGVDYQTENKNSALSVRCILSK